MRSIFLFLLVFNICCSNKDKEALTQTTIIQPQDIQQNTNKDTEEDTYSIWEDPCVNCDWYFCENLDSVWQKQICMNECEDPKTIVYESECEEKLQCNPTQYLIEKDVHCIDEKNNPGLQDKVCNKGIIQYTKCIANCSEEVCNGIDDDCDGETDEGELNACGFCGPEPAEECNAFDDDCDGQVDEDLVRVCTSVCGNGIEYCVNGWWNCTAKKPEIEICDGKDNDCDGLIDEFLNCLCTEKDLGSLIPCAEEPLTCGEGYKTCECGDNDCNIYVMTECLATCHWFPETIAEGETCDPHLGKVAEEQCNDHDDDCDVLVDEDLYSICYSGPPNTLYVGICKPGTYTCVEGDWGSKNEDDIFVSGLCLNEVKPMEEDICNGEDTNCDGEIEKELTPTDIVLIIDLSGSMAVEINSVLTALNQFAQFYSDSEVIKWGLITVANKKPYSSGEEQTRIEINLSSFENFIDTFADVNFNWAGNGGNEQTLDSLYLSIKNLSGGGTYDLNSAEWQYVPIINSSVPEIKKWNINWRQEAKRVIIMFTDEEPQSYLIPQIEEEDVILAMQSAPDFYFYLFGSFLAELTWEEIIDSSPNNDIYPLSYSSTQMYTNLLEILDETACSSN